MGQNNFLELKFWFKLKLAAAATVITTILVESIITAISVLKLR